MKKATMYGTKMMVLNTDTMTVDLFEVDDIKKSFKDWEIKGETTNTKQMPQERLAKFDELWASIGSRVL